MAVGVEQDATAIAILEVGDLPTRVGLPQADAIPVPRRQQPAVCTEFRSQHRQGVAPLTTIAEHGRVERATFVARGNFPETDVATGPEGQSPVIQREAQRFSRCGRQVFSGSGIPQAGRSVRARGRQQITRARRIGR